MTNILKNLLVLTGYSDRDTLVLQEAAPEIIKWNSLLANCFYDLLSRESGAVQAGQASYPVRKEDVKYWLGDILTGNVDQVFWEQQWLIGLLNIKWHISNTRMIGIFNRLQLLFLNRCLEKFDVDYAAEVFGAFKRLTDIITGLITESFTQNVFEIIENVSGIQKPLMERLVLMEIDRSLSLQRALHASSGKISHIPV